MLNEIPTARVTFEIQKFLPITEGLTTITNLVCDDIPDRVWKAPDPDGQWVLHITGQVNVVLAVVDPLGTIQDYALLAVAFTQKTDCDFPGLRSDSTGAKNFIHRQLNADGTLSFQDAYVHFGPGYRYDVKIILQRLSDGTVGMIDPDVENDNVPPLAAAIVPGLAAVARAQQEGAARLATPDASAADAR
jgi:hypothetical protein